MKKILLLTFLPFLASCGKTNSAPSSVIHNKTNVNSSEENNGEEVWQKIDENMILEVYVKVDEHYKYSSSNYENIEYCVNDYEYSLEIKVNYVFKERQYQDYFYGKTLNYYVTRWN